MARVCASTSLIPAVNKLATLPLLFAGTEEQKQRWLPQIADGSAMASYCLTEPGSGSDAAAMRSRAVRDGDDYVINGTKRFITGGGVSKLYIYYAVTDPDAGSKGISAFILEDSMPGFEIGKHQQAGHPGSPSPNTSATTSGSRPPTASATSIRVPPGPPGPRPQPGHHRRPGPRHRPGRLRLRPRLPHEREQFGQPIADSQGINFMLADLARQLEAASARSTRPPPKPTATTPTLTFAAAAAKCFASDIARRVTTDAVQSRGVRVRERVPSGARDAGTRK